MKKYLLDFCERKLSADEAEEYFKYDVIEMYKSGKDISIYLEIENDYIKFFKNLFEINNYEVEIVFKNFSIDLNTVLFDEEKIIYDITTLVKNREKVIRKENRIVEEIEEETMTVEEIKNKVHEIVSVELLAPEDMKLLATLIETKNREKIIMCLKDFIEFAKRIDKEYLATAIIELIEEIEEKEIE